MTLAAAVVLLATTLVHDDARDEDVALPPIVATELTAAAAKAGCVLRRGRVRGRGLVTGGPRSAPAEPAVYEDRRPPAPAIVAAIRRGAVVIDYRPDVPRDGIEALGALQRAVPRGTILAPNGEMEFVVAVTAWRRLLGCRRLDGRTLDAVRLFRGRFIGSGPDPAP